MSKIEQFWRDATAEDVAEIVKTGKLIPARFRDDETRDWQFGELTGFSLKACRGQWQAHPYYFCECQVYREPSWYANRPDPGKGFRLLEKFPDEELKPGDEYFDRTTIKWRCSTNAKAGMPQPEKVWYRRRIEPVEPEPRHYVLRVGDTVENPNGDRIKVVSPGFEQSHYALKVGDTISTPNGQTITITEKGFEVTQ